MRFNGYETTNYPNGISTTLAATNNGTGAPFSGVNTGAIGEFSSVTTLTAAQVLALNATPVQLLPAPGANLAIVLRAVLLELLYGGTAYTNGGNANIQFLANATVVSDVTQANFNGLITATANSILLVDSPFINTVLARANLVNQPLNVNLTAALAAGNSRLQINTFFSVVPV